MAVPASGNLRPWQSTAVQAAKTKVTTAQLLRPDSDFADSTAPRMATAAPDVLRISVVRHAMDSQRSLNVVASPVRDRSTARCRARPRDQPLDVLGRVHVQTVLGATIAPLGNDNQRSTGSPWLRQRKIHHLRKSRGCRIASTLIDVSFLEGLQRPISLSAARCSTSRCGSCARKHGMQAVLLRPRRRPCNRQSFREGSWRSTRCGSGLDDRKTGRGA